MSPDALSVGELQAGSGTAKAPRLPEGWAWATLGEILPLEYGKALPERLRDSTGEVAVYGSSGRLGSHTAAMVTGPTLVVGRKGSAGAVFLCNEDCWPIDTVYFTKPTPVVDLRYGFYFLKWKALGRLDQSTAIPSLSRDIYSDVVIPVAPLTEQRRIVARIDELFAEIGEGEAALQRARQGLDTWRSALLKAAVTGELTRGWREANRPTETGADLVTRIRATPEAPTSRSSLTRRPAASGALDANSLPALPDGWAWATLGECISRLTSGSRDWSQYYDQGSAIFIMAQNIRPGRYNHNYVKHVAPPAGDPETTRTRVRKNGANTGDVCRVDFDADEYFVCQSVALVRPLLSEMSEFLELYFVARDGGRGEFEKVIYGAGRPHLSFNQLLETRVPIPSLVEMREIVQRVRQEEEAAFSEQEFSGFHRDLLALRQSILKAAFEGRLVPQDPTDEPASVLLTRLRDGSPSNGARRRRARAAVDVSHPSLPGLTGQRLHPRGGLAGND